MVENWGHNLKGSSSTTKKYAKLVPWEEDTKSGAEETKAQEKQRHYRSYRPKNRIPTPAVRAIPVGYEEDDRIAKELKRDGLPLTAENKALYKELDEEIREGEILRSALNRPQVYH